MDFQDLFSPEVLESTKTLMDHPLEWMNWAPGPVQPIRWEQDVPVYTSQQINLYGTPDGWGVACYLIVELREDASPMVMDFHMEQERKLRPIHRYCRVERFQSILSQLIACKGRVPASLIALIQKTGYDRHPDRVWNSIRAILKANKGRRYYNRIASILERLGYERKIKVGDRNDLMLLIIRDFQCLSVRFERIKLQLNRVYFPSLRFIACKLLEAHQVTFEFRVPLVRTPRKLKSMEKIWTLLLSE